jgi:hypothetical protein
MIRLDLPPAAGQDVVCRPTSVLRLSRRLCAHVYFGRSLAGIPTGRW